MNGFGEPNMGNPSVRFDEGRERVGHWPVCLSIHPSPPTLLAPIPTQEKRSTICMQIPLGDSWGKLLSFFRGGNRGVSSL